MYLLAPDAFRMGLIFGDSFAPGDFISTSRESFNKKAVPKDVVKKDANLSSIGPGRDARVDYGQRKTVVDPTLRAAFEATGRTALENSRKKRDDQASQVDCSIVGAKFVGETEATAAGRLGPVWRQPEVTLGHSSFHSPVNPITHRAVRSTAAFEHPNTAATTKMISIDCVAKMDNRKWL